MTDEFDFEMPDMDELFNQMSESMKGMEEAMQGMGDAMEEAQEAMQDIPDMGEILSAFSGLSDTIPEQMGDLGEALGGFGELHKKNLEDLSGQPDWRLDAKIRIGEVLELKVEAAFDLQSALQAYQSTQGTQMDDAINSVLGNIPDIDADSALGDRIKEQLKQGRSAARISTVQIISCSIQGKPASAAESLKLSPEAGIPIAVQDEKISFEFAPMLSIKNRWENADIPVFAPMNSDTQLSIRKFDDEVPFKERFHIQQDELQILIEIGFQAL